METAKFILRGLKVVSRFRTRLRKENTLRKIIHRESEIVKSVWELESGIPSDQICRRLSISLRTLDQWRKNMLG